MYEKVWIPLTDVSTDDVQKITKVNMYFLKNIELGFFVAELDFVTPSESKYDLVFRVPELDKYNFAKSEASVLAAKDDESASLVNVSLEPGKLTVTGYPFVEETHYEVNIQLILRMISGERILLE